ncbi:hypothetical protein AnigIFM56816_007153 [Aspergillus niger]|nr:hypothetical protein AnigIFM56816_007153 [Aspergillus niger]
MASAGLICQGEGGRRYRLVRPLGAPVRGKGCNVWLGLDDSKPDAEYIMKRPPADQNEESWSGALSAFKHELEMQRLFAKDPMIRRLIDYVPESEPSGPMMVLEAFTDSLWDARNPEEAYMWANTMIEKGVSGEDIQFLVEVLNPDPNARLTVREILERVSGSLTGLA